MASSAAGRARPLIPFSTGDALTSSAIDLGQTRQSACRTRGVRAHPRGCRARGPRDGWAKEAIREPDRPPGQPVPDRDALDRPARRLAAARYRARRRQRRARRSNADSDRARSRSATAFASSCKPASSSVVFRSRARGSSAARQPDGRWDLGALVKRDTREQERTGSEPADRSAVDRDHRRPDLAARSARLRRRARADRLRGVEREVRFRLLPRSLDADLRSRLVDRPRTRSVGPAADRSVRARTRRLVLRAFLGAHGALRLHARRTDRHIAASRPCST